MISSWVCRLHPCQNPKLPYELQLKSPRIWIHNETHVKAPIYLFDDSFSSLDYKTDAILRGPIWAKTLERLVGTVFKTSAKHSIDAVSALAIGSGVCGFLLQSMFDYTFYNYRMMAMFFMILALGVALKACKGEEKWLK